MGSEKEEIAGQARNDEVGGCRNDLTSAQVLRLIIKD